MFAFRLALFSVLWLGLIYGFNSLLAHKLLPVNVRRLFVYASTMAALGVLGELVYDTAYDYCLGRPLWVYRLAGIHDAYTSVYSLFLWGGIIGLHLYLLHGTLQKKGITSVHQLAFIFCGEAILLEALVNLSYRMVFNDFIYYYLPPDLGHITSIQTLPLYLLAGYITVTALGLAHRSPRLASLGSTILALSLVGVGILLR